MNYARQLAKLVSVASCAAASVLIAAPAFAQPKVLVAEPAEGATVAKVSKVRLTFSEPLIPAMSGVDVVMTSMPGMENHAAMKMSGVKVSVGPDGKTLEASFARPLPVGSYEADWHAASSDAHRVSGKVTFLVK